jgi:hypothetical protein
MGEGLMTNLNRHMAGKVWVDLPDFAEALRIARRCLRHQEQTGK